MCDVGSTFLSLLQRKLIMVWEKNAGDVFKFSEHMVKVPKPVICVPYFYREQFHCANACISEDQSFVSLGW